MGRGGRSAGGSSWARGVAIGALIALCAAPVSATVLIGACCQSGGGCAEVPELTCLDGGGQFVGGQCANIDCVRPLAAPMMSIIGLVAVFGVLTAFGAYHLFAVGRR